MADSKSQIDAAAIAVKSVLESHPDYPGANVKINDAIRRQGLTAKLQRSPLGSDARMKTVIKLFDLRAGSYVELVRDMKLQNAFVFALKVISHTAWIEFTGFPLKELNPSSPEGQRHLQTILNRARHWEIEGFRRLMPSSDKAKAKPKARQGYRAHIRAWMKDKQIETVALAAKRLAVSESTLKSIMTNKGETRYGADTLKRILEATGYKRS